ncbi:hypothetical protein JHK85_004602 [Glycine max]|nr:hypothetical protein JHK85_004602 [Glycine max]
MESMSEKEKREFGFDVKSIDWNDYITNVHIPGLRRHVMKGRGMGNYRGTKFKLTKEISTNLNN